MNKQTMKNLIEKWECIDDTQREIYEQCKEELDDCELDEFYDFVNELFGRISGVVDLINQQNPTILERMQFGCVLGIQTACSVDKLFHTEYNIDEIMEGINE